MVKAVTPNQLQRDSPLRLGIAGKVHGRDGFRAELACHGAAPAAPVLAETLVRMPGDADVISVALQPENVDAT